MICSIIGFFAEKVIVKQGGEKNGVDLSNGVGMRKVGEVGMIQIDISMPKNCGECPICNEYLMCGVPCNGRGWGENDVSDYFTNGRPEWCPLKEQEAVEPIPYHRSDGTIFKYECRQCRTKIFKNDLFCRHCGRSVKWE